MGRRSSTHVSTHARDTLRRLRCARARMHTLTRAYMITNRYSTARARIPLVYPPTRTSVNTPFLVGRRRPQTGVRGGGGARAHDGLNPRPRHRVHTRACARTIDQPPNGYPPSLSRSLAPNSVHIYTRAHLDTHTVCTRTPNTPTHTHTRTHTHTYTHTTTATLLFLPSFPVPPSPRVSHKPHTAPHLYRRPREVPHQ